MSYDENKFEGWDCFTISCNDLQKNILLPIWNELYNQLGDQAREIVDKGDVSVDEPVYHKGIQKRRPVRDEEEDLQRPANQLFTVMRFFDLFCFALMEAENGDKTFTYVPSILQQLIFAKQAIDEQKEGYYLVLLHYSNRGWVSQRLLDSDFFLKWYRPMRKCETYQLIYRLYETERIMHIFKEDGTYNEFDDKNPLKYPDGTEYNIARFGTHISYRWPKISHEIAVLMKTHWALRDFKTIDMICPMRDDAKDVDCIRIGKGQDTPSKERL
jgi:hypothetical protein